MTKHAEALRREDLLLAPWAQRTSASGGRKHFEPPHPYRTAYQRDRDRLIHSAACRRLAGKTQVFTGEAGDYHRTRLTHTLEVASVARSLGRALRLNEDLVEALALLHDLGHPPFGHAGEETLDALLSAEEGFSHNRQALRIVEELEAGAPGRPGLNLSAEVLAGQVSRADLPRSASPLVEAQVVDAVDSVVYDSHDPDDAIEVGLISLDEWREVGLWRDAVKRVERRWSSLTPRELRRAVAHELIDWQVGDLLAETERRLVDAKIANVDDVRRAGLLVAPSAEVAEAKAELEAFLFERVYRHPEVLARRRRLQAILAEAFELLARDPSLLPEPWQARREIAPLRRTIADYLASLTDRGAMREQERLTASKK